MMRSALSVRPALADPRLPAGRRDHGSARLLGRQRVGADPLIEPSSFTRKCNSGLAVALVFFAGMTGTLLTLKLAAPELLLGLGIGLLMVLVLALTSMLPRREREHDASALAAEVSPQAA
jgi:hypothetical protein